MGVSPGGVRRRFRCGLPVRGFVVVGRCGARGVRGVVPGVCVGGWCGPGCSVVPGCLRTGQWMCVTKKFLVCVCLAVP